MEALGTLLEINAADLGEAEAIQVQQAALF